MPRKTREQFVSNRDLAREAHKSKMYQSGRGLKQLKEIRPSWKRVRKRGGVRGD